LTVSNPTKYHHASYVGQLIQVTFFLFLLFFFFLFLKLPPYTLAGFDLTTHTSAGGDDTTRPHRHGFFLFSSSFFLFFFSTGISDTVPSRFLLQAGSNTAKVTRHHFHHFPTLSLEHLSLSLGPSNLALHSLLYPRPA
jgi:hypothetical protein